MNRQILEDIKTEYKAYLEHLCFAESCLQDLVKRTDKYLCNYSKSKHYDEIFAENLDINLLYFENFLERINTILDDVEGVNILKLKEPQINNVVNIDEYVRIPNDYDRDIYVDINNPIDWTK